jgi:plasmid stabilization system protein ParE
VDVERLHDFLADKNPQAARNAIIQAAARQLGDFPEIGRPMDDDSNRREVFAAFGAGALCCDTASTTKAGL